MHVDIEAGTVETKGVGGLVEVGGNSSGGASGRHGGKGEESKRQHGGEVWRFEVEDRNGGIGVDSSVANGGMKDIAGNGFGGVVKSEERSMSGNYGRIVGTEDCSC